MRALAVAGWDNDRQLPMRSACVLLLLHAWCQQHHFFGTAFAVPYRAHTVITSYNKINQDHVFFLHMRSRVSDGYGSPGADWARRGFCERWGEHPWALDGRHTPCLQRNIRVDNSLYKAMNKRHDSQHLNDSFHASH